MGTIRKQKIGGVRAICTQRSRRFSNRLPMPTAKRVAPFVARGRQGEHPRHRPVPMAPDPRRLHGYLPTPTATHRRRTSYWAQVPLVCRCPGNSDSPPTNRPHRVKTASDYGYTDTDILKYAAVRRSPQMGTTDSGRADGERSHPFAAAGAPLTPSVAAAPTEPVVLGRRRAIRTRRTVDLSPAQRRALDIWQRDAADRLGIAGHRTRGPRHARRPTTERPQPRRTDHPDHPCPAVTSRSSRGALQRDR